VLICAVMPALSACSGATATVLGGIGSIGSAISAADKVSEAASPYIAKGCADYAAAKAAADALVSAGVLTGSTAAKVSSVESFGDAACASPPDGDPLSTAVWLGKLVGQLTTLTATL
jgi:hypothetical protein